MKTFITLIKKKINGVIASMIATGVVLLILAVLIVWTDFVLRLIVGLAVIIMAFGFFFGACKIWSLKREVEKYLGIK